MLSVIFQRKYMMKLHFFLTTFLTFSINCNDVSGTEKEKGKTNKISVEEYIARALARELIKHPKYQDQVRNQNVMNFS